MLRTAGSALKKTACIVALPFLEFLFIRVYLHSYLGERIGYRGMIDADILVPGTLAIFFFVFALGRSHSLKLGFQKKIAPFHGGLFLVLFATTQLFSNLRTQFPETFLPAWLVLAFTTFSSALFLFVPFDFILQKRARRLWIPVLLLAGSKFIANGAQSLFGESMLRLASKLTYRFSSLFSDKLTSNDFNSYGDLYVWVNHPLHTISVGIGCSGLDGIALALFSLTVTWVVEQKRYSNLTWFTILSASIPVMMAANVLRLSLILGTHVVLITQVGPLSYLVRRLLVHWHNFLGWGFYVGALIAFYVFALPLWRTRKIDKDGTPAILKPLEQLPLQR